MTKAEELVGLARQIDACVEDATRGVAVAGFPNVEQQPDHRVQCLAAGLRATAKALRALASSESGA